MILLNLLYAVVDGFVDGESVINSLYCDITLDITSQQSNNIIILEDLEHRDDKNGYIYESVFIKADCIIKNISYNLKNTNKARKKALFYYIFIVSWLPIILSLLGYYLLFKGNVLAVFASLLIFMIFTIPSWRKASKVKKYYSNEYAKQVLLHQFDKLKYEKQKNNFDAPNDVLSKSVYKTLNFLFKKNK